MRRLAALVNPAGGLAYHLRAVRYRDGLWRPLRDALATWLSEWRPTERHLILVGPSAGYTLPMTWLGQFERLTALEPDPLAMWLFRRRIKRDTNSVPLTLLSDDHLVDDPARFVSLAKAHPDAAILFCNVVGQLRHLIDSNDDCRLAAVKQAVRSAIEGRSWATYHDRVSGAARPKIADTGLRVSQRLTDEELSALYVATDTQVTLFDHATDGVFPAQLPHSYFAWQLTPGYVHLVEGVHQVG